jgi:hypothetical protein
MGKNECLLMYSPKLTTDIGKITLHEKTHNEHTEEPTDHEKYHSCTLSGALCSKPDFRLIVVLRSKFH